MTSSSSLHDVERPLPDEYIHTLVPGLVQSEPRHAGGQQTHHSHGGAAELTCRGVQSNQYYQVVMTYPGTVYVRFNEAKICQI